MTKAAGLTELIRNLVEQKLLDESRLDQYQLAYLKVKMQRSGEAYRALALVVHATLPTGVYSQRGIEKIVKVYFGTVIGDAAMRTDLRCTQRKLEDYKLQVRTSMNEIRIGLRAELEKMNKVLEKLPE